MLRAFLACAALAVACGGPTVRSSATIPAAGDPTADAVRRVVEPLYTELGLGGGMVVALVDPSRDGGVTYLRFGRTSPEVAEAPGADAIFEIGSISKVLTALLLADAALRGEVGLDTPVGKLLPFGVRFPDKDGVRATLEHLASHRAGLPSLPPNLSPASIDDPYADYGVHQLHAYLERAELLYVPGSRYAYSNLGAGLLGHLLAARLGTSYAEAVRARVLAPLGLDETWIDVPGKAEPRIVPGTGMMGRPAPAWHFDALAGAGAWRSTPAQMVALVQAAAAAAAGKDVPLADALRRSIAPVAEVPGGQIGLAWHIDERGVVWHNGGTGGYASFIGFDPATSKGVVVLSSSSSPLATRLGMSIFDLYGGGELDLGLAFVEVPAAELDKLAGTYQFADGSNVEVRRAGDTLELGIGDEAVRVHPRSPTQFVFLEIEAAVQFIVDAQGVVQGLVFRSADGDAVAQKVVAP